MRRRARGELSRRIGETRDGRATLLALGERAEWGRVYRMQRGDLGRSENVAPPPPRDMDVFERVAHTVCAVECSLCVRAVADAGDAARVSSTAWVRRFG